MDFYIIIPAHNEEQYIGSCLNSIVNQTFLPKKVIVVNDNSTDGTLEIINQYAANHHWIQCLTIDSSKEHIPGKKVINAFYKGFEELDDDYDIICKYDADIIFPENYLESLKTIFEADKTIGIAGGLAFIKKGDRWVYENIASKSHIRGPIKSYRKDCFIDIEGLRNSIGWDTVDVLLAQYHGWKVATNQDLHVKHLKPTGKNYNKNTKYYFGEGLYKMRLGVVLMLLSSIKSALNKRSFKYFTNSVLGYFKAKRSNVPYIVTKAQGTFIRKLRWKKILKKVF